MMKTMALLSLLTIASPVTLGAQTSGTTTTTTTNIRMTGGKSMTLGGYVEADADGGYVLTHVADKDGVFHSYVLVSTNPFFARHVGERVQVEGKVGDRAHGQVSVVSDTTAEGVNSHIETDARHDAAAVRYLSADHMRTIATSCS
jgi:hypothetical protein